MQRRIPLALLALAVLALALAACGSDEDGEGGAVASVADDTTADTAAAGGDAADGDDADPKDRQDALLAYARCMRENGVDMADPQPGEPFRVEVRKSVNGEDTSEKAQKACQKHLRGAIGELSAEDREAMREAGLKFARCMREHGIDMPDPQPDGGMLFKAGQGGIDPEDPTFQKAQKACEPLMRSIRERADGGNDGEEER
jgi:hypothetical protein